MNDSAEHASIVTMSKRTNPFTGRRFLLTTLLIFGGVLGGNAATPAPAAETDARRDATVNAIERVLPSVVNIGTRTRRERRGFYYDWFRDNLSPFVQELPPQESAGSGVIIDEDGYVLTNVHVVEEADEIWVRLSDGRVIQAKPIIGNRKSDVALLQLRGKPGEKFQAAKFAAADDLLLGETVIALGNPFGLGGSVSRGILSSKSRRPATDGGEPLELPDWLQTDAAINPGNSGGALINLRGELIGINVAVFRGGQGIGFAIPIKRVAEALSEIFTPEALKQLWFGALIKAGSPPLKVWGVQHGSPAESAGLKLGDVVVSVNGQTPKSFFGMMRELINAGEKGEAALVVQRDGEQKKLTVKLVPEKTFFNAGLLQKKLGMTLQELTPELMDSLGFTRGSGLVIAAVDQTGSATEAGLQPRTLIRGIDGIATAELVDAAKIVYEKKKGETVKLNVVVPVRRGNVAAYREANVTLTVR